MASDEMRKKWGTIFMGDREASVEQLNAMRERVDHDRLQKERAEDYMERVRARAADRAREILGQAYTERQKVLDEAKGEAAAQKRLAAQECAKIKAEGESIRSMAQSELARAQEELEKAVQIRDGAYEEGYNKGMGQAGVELQEFRGELGQSLGALMRAIERQRKAILEQWRKDLSELVQAAVQAGTGLILQKEHENILRSLVYKSLDLLESRGAISARVNPRDEETVSDLFRAARERFPELRQWTVSGDESIEPGGLVVESGTGSVDLRRANFREMVDGILEHLGLPEQENERKEEMEVASLVEKEVAHIASLTPEPDHPVDEPVAEAAAVPEPEIAEQEALPDEGVAPAEEARTAAEAEPEPIIPDTPAAQADVAPADPSLAELEDELFPLEEENPVQAQEPAESDNANDEAAREPKAAPAGNSQPKPSTDPELDSRILTEGGFL